MAGIEDLKILLSSMKPELDSREFVFCTFDNPLSMEAITDLTPIGTFWEKEGLTLIITTDDALSNGIRFDTVYKLISLTVHSSLNAVGLTAAIATKLASKDISANVVAAYYHDHIFIQKEKAGQAMEAIMELQAESLVNALRLFLRIIGSTLLKHPFIYLRMLFVKILYAMSFTF